MLVAAIAARNSGLDPRAELRGRHSRVMLAEIFVEVILAKMLVEVILALRVVAAKVILAARVDSSGIGGAGVATVSDALGHKLRGELEDLLSGIEQDDAAPSPAPGVVDAAPRVAELVHGELTSCFTLTIDRLGRPAACRPKFGGTTSPHRRKIVAARAYQRDTIAPVCQ